MAETDVILDQNFFNIFAAWFDSDVVDIYDPQEVENAARACAGDLKQNHFDLGGLIRELTEFLETWDSQRILKFINATNVDWLFDERTEHILKDALVITIDELKYHQRLPSD